MTNYFQVSSDVDPSDLGVNIRFKGSQRIIDRVRGAQDHLVTEIKLAIPDDYEPDDPGIVEMTFFIPRNIIDVDSPIKRTLDAIEKALKAKGYDWHDGNIKTIHATKSVRAEPGIRIAMY